MQVDEIIDIHQTVNLTIDTESDDANTALDINKSRSRMLKLFLTDGIQDIVALELEYFAFMSSNSNNKLVPGCKILISNFIIHYGMILLFNQGIVVAPPVLEILGGYVESLIQFQEQKLSISNGIATKESNSTTTIGLKDDVSKSIVNSSNNNNNNNRSSNDHTMVNGNNNNMNRSSIDHTMVNGNSNNNMNRSSNDHTIVNGNSNNNMNRSSNDHTMVNGNSNNNMNRSSNDHTMVNGNNNNNMNRSSNDHTIVNGNNNNNMNRSSIDYTIVNGNSNNNMNRSSNDYTIVNGNNNNNNSISAALLINGNSSKSKNVSKVQQLLDEEIYDTAFGVKPINTIPISIYPSTFESQTLDSYVYDPVIPTMAYEQEMFGQGKEIASGEVDKEQYNNQWDDELTSDMYVEEMPGDQNGHLERDVVCVDESVVYHSSIIVNEDTHQDEDYSYEVPPLRDEQIAMQAEYPSFDIEEDSYSNKVLTLPQPIYSLDGMTANANVMNNSNSQISTIRPDTSKTGNAALIQYIESHSNSLSRNPINLTTLASLYCMPALSTGCIHGSISNISRFKVLTTRLENKYPPRVDYQFEVHVIMDDGDCNNNRDLSGAFLPESYRVVQLEPEFVTNHLNITAAEYYSMVNKKNQTKDEKSSIKMQFCLHFSTCTGIFEMQIIHPANEPSRIICKNFLPKHRITDICKTKLLSFSHML